MHGDSMQDRVKVYSPDGVELAPCKPVRARKLMKKGRARVYGKEPFAIQLLPKEQGPIETQTASLKGRTGGEA